MPTAARARTWIAAGPITTCSWLSAGRSVPRSRAGRESGRQSALVSLAAFLRSRCGYLYRLASAKNSTRRRNHPSSPHMAACAQRGNRGRGIPGVTVAPNGGQPHGRAHPRRTSTSLRCHGIAEQVAPGAGSRRIAAGAVLRRRGIRMYDSRRRATRALPRPQRGDAPARLVYLSRHVDPARRGAGGRTCCVRREDLHPALVQLFVQAAGRIQGGEPLDRARRAVPNAANTSSRSPRRSALRPHRPAAMQRTAVLVLQPGGPHVGRAHFIIAILIRCRGGFRRFTIFRIRSRIFVVPDLRASRTVWALRRDRANC